MISLIKTSVVSFTTLWLSGCCSPSVPTGANSDRELAVNESATILVKARNQLTHSGIIVDPSHTYTVSVDPKDKWKDLNIEANADGFPGGPLISAFRAWKRLPTANWFALLGQVEGSPPLPISQFRPLKRGELTLFPNDVCWMYWNNSGDITATVTRNK